MKPQIIATIKQWAKDPEYFAGVEIFRSINSGLAHTLSQNATQPNIRKLTMKLAFFARIDPPATYVALPQQPNAAPPTPQQPQTTSQQPETKIEQPSEIPPDVKLVMKEHAVLFQLRSQMSEKRETLGTANDEKTKKDRRIIGQTISELSQRIELMYNARENYFKHGTMPDMQALFPVEFKDQNPDELEKKRLNLMKSLNRDKTMLNFSQYKRKKKPDPIPEGPKRDEVLARIEAKTREIEEIDNILKSFKQ